MFHLILLFLLKPIENALFAFATLHVTLVYRRIFNTSQRGILSRSAIQKSFPDMRSPDYHSFFELCLDLFFFYVCFWTFQLSSLQMI